MGGGVGTVGTFNDRELQVMAGNAPYLTPPSPYPIARNNPCCIPVNIFLSPARASLSPYVALHVDPRLLSSHSARPTELLRFQDTISPVLGGGGGITSHLVCTRTPWDCEGWARSMNLFPFRLVVFQFLFERFVSFCINFGNLILSSVA